MHRDSRSIHTRSSSQNPNTQNTYGTELTTNYSDNLSDTELMAPPVEFEETQLNLRNSNNMPDSEFSPIQESLSNIDSIPDEQNSSENYEITEELPDPSTLLSLYYSHQGTVNSEEIIAEANEENQEDFKFRFSRMSPIAGGTPSRSRTAPPRPLTDREVFRETKEFMCLESAALSTADLILKSDGKLDLDSQEGNNNCKNFLSKLEDLAVVFKIKVSNRSYRESFSQPYKALYKENTLCYLTEILDSAQEGLPYILVNSEKYVFSSGVLHSGEQLYISFVKIKELLRDTYDVYF